jgi:hypothetical protein
MRVERRDLVDFGQRHLHFQSECREVRGGEIAVLILNEVQMLDQKIATAWPVSQKPPDLDQRLWINLTSFRGTRWPASSAPPSRGCRRLLLFHKTHSENPCET